MSNDYLGKDIKKLGFGFMRLPQVDGVIDIEHTKKMVDKFLEKGYTYFDTAVPYLGQKSEAALRTALVDRYPREQYQIATKLSIQCLGPDMSAEQLFEQSLEILGVEYVDYYLIHAINKTKAQQYEEVGAWELLKEKKAQGKIKHFGLSFHDKPEVLDEILTAHPEAEFVQLQLNYADWENNAVQARRCYEIAVAHGKPIIVMEPVKGGTLSALVPEAESVLKSLKPEDSIASWAVRYCASLDHIITILSGMSTLEQVEDNTTTMDKFTPLTSEEGNAIEKVVEILENIPTIPCTDCKYCTENCPADINIPRYFGIMNLHLRYDADQNTASNINSFRFASKNASVPSACVECGTCEKRCPQAIPIIQHLKEMKEIYEN